MLDREDQLIIQSLDKRLGALTPFTPILTKTSKLEAWHHNVIGAIALRTRANFYHLRASIQGRSVEYTAWSSRNLLELFVWAVYATKSKDNARRLFEDQLIDTADLISRLRDLVKLHNANVNENLQQLAKDEIALNQERVNSNLQENDKFLVVGKVAKLVGVEGTFYSFNGVLSKLAHPTALSLLLALPPVEEQKIRNFMLRSGLIFAKDVLDIVAEYFRAEGIDTALIEDPEFTYPPTFRPS